jgi:hypothetical protein
MSRSPLAREQFPCQLRPSHKMQNYQIVMIVTGVIWRSVNQSVNNPDAQEAQAPWASRRFFPRWAWCFRATRPLHVTWHGKVQRPYGRRRVREP